MSRKTEALKHLRSVIDRSDTCDRIEIIDAESIAWDAGASFEETDAITVHIKERKKYKV